ncbi:MAG TPA: chitin deacetylase [Cellvibrio sp.]|uniref:polysaccharide deacetylase family protein n=1 Tax=Cellvibrio sp. TaxID=1965322 RepID=UPI000ED29F3B|nr:polysaccharide deacetylase family protein [Cellvibrio sp.]HCS64584.1 chitin deacetylase [Cellvibrio sp.]
MKQLLKQIATSAASHFGPHRMSWLQQDPQLWVMMYHRILPRDDIRYQLEEPGMIITPDTFSMHLRELKRHFDLMDFSEWLSLREAGKPLPRRACVITFDDGWYDNYEYALPIINAEATPVTLFAVVEKIGTDFQFWPNIVSALLHSNALSAMQQQPVFARALAQTGTSGDTKNREFIAAVIKALKQSSDADIFAALAALHWQTLLTFSIPRGLMTWDELRSMTQSGLVKIGSHTCNHKRLNAQLSSDEITHEIVASKTLLQAQINDAVDIFCFPNGDYNQAALDAVTTTYRAAVTTQRGIVNAARTPAHQLCRIGVHEQVSHTPRLLGARLSGWV